MTMPAMPQQMQVPDNVVTIDKVMRLLVAARGDAMKYKPDTVPFQFIENKPVLTGEQIAGDKLLQDFVRQFSHCFEHLANYDAVAFYPDGVPK